MSDKIKPEVALYEKLMAIFPGYKGYKEKELIRETDKLVRQRLYLMLKEIEGFLRGLYSRAGLIQLTPSDLNMMDSAIYRVDSVAEKILHSPSGYKPLFNVVKVDEGKLGRLLEFDLSLGESVAALLNEVKDKSGKVSTIDDIRGLFQRVLAEIEKIEELVNTRENYIQLL
jgi:hypothetical protein